jgi:chromatin structure-remodeling complex subunit SFH1
MLFASISAQYFTAYMKNLQTWSTTATPPPKNSTTAARSTRARNTRSALAGTPTPYTPAAYQPPLAAVPLAPPAPPVAPNPPRPPLPTALQALQSTYASRLRTGATLLMQPVIAASSASGARTATRRGGVVNYADPGSGDELPDAGALDSDDSDFVASGGTRTSLRQGRNRQTAGMSVFNSNTGLTTTSHQPATAARAEKAELDQSYLGMVPPAKFIKPKWIHPTVHVYPCVSCIFHLTLPLIYLYVGVEHKM